MSIAEEQRNGEFTAVESMADRALLLALERAADVLGDTNFAGLVSVVYTKEHEVLFTLVPEEDEPFTPTDLRAFQGMGENLSIQYLRTVRLLLEPDKVEFFFPMKVVYVQ